MLKGLDRHGAPHSGFRSKTGGRRKEARGFDPPPPDPSPSACRAVLSRLAGVSRTEISHLDWVTKPHSTKTQEAVVSKLTAVLVLAAAALVVAGCGSSGSGTTSTTAPTKSATSTKGVKVSAKQIASLGSVLVNEEGKALYVFAPDKASKVTCQGECVAIWPPLRLESGQKAIATGAVKAKLLGKDSDPEGGAVITYAGWPLYTYTGDTSAGTATGQGLNLNGGYWYVISPSGKVIK
jgi:predicted lipoprotein with Yx(FWY)xxD motif